MIHNPNNEKYKSALTGLPFETREIGKAAVEFRHGRGRKMETHNFHLRPILRNPPDIERLGRAILELAMRSPNKASDQKPAEK